MKYVVMLLSVFVLSACDAKNGDGVAETSSQPKQFKLYGETPNCVIYKARSGGWVTTVAESKNPGIHCAVSNY